MALSELMIADGPAIYYDAGFRVVLEDHMNFLRTSPTTTVLVIPPGEAWKFEFDLYGLLRKYGVAPHLHWLTMRMNKMTSPEEFTADIEQLLIPDQVVVSRLQQSHQTSRRVT